MRVIQSQTFNVFFQNGGRAPDAQVLDPPLKYTKTLICLVAIAVISAILSFAIPTPSRSAHTRIV